MPDSPPTPRRRWFRFTLRLLLLLVAVLAIPMAWKVNRVQNQRRVLATLTPFGAEVIWSYQHLGAVAPLGPQWLRRLLGDDFFADVHHINIDNAGVTDDVVAEIAALSNLKSLYVGSDACNCLPGPWNRYEPAVGC